MNTAYCNPKRLSVLSSNNVDRTGRSLIANRKPCTKLLRGESTLGLISLGSLRIRSNAPIPARKLTPLMKKHHAGPPRAIANPAVAGRGDRAPLHDDDSP